LSSGRPRAVCTRVRCNLFPSPRVCRLTVVSVSRCDQRSSACGAAVAFSSTSILPAFAVAILVRDDPLAEHERLTAPSFRVALSGEAGGPALLVVGISRPAFPVIAAAPDSWAFVLRVRLERSPERRLVEVVARFLRPTTSLLVQMSQQNPFLH
jgi:hypothetical protein